MDIGNTYKNLVKMARVFSEISSRRDRQTDRQTDMLITIATAPAGEVNMQPHKSRCQL